MNQIRQQKGLPALGKEMWGTDSQSFSLHTAPHARSIRPQYNEIKMGKGLVSHFEGI
jgi:hypothetical protein